MYSSSRPSGQVVKQHSLGKCSCWNALLGIGICLVHCCYKATHIQAVTQNGHYRPSHLNSSNSTFKGTQFLLRPCQKQNTSTSYTGVLLQLQGFLFMLKDSAVQAPLRGVKAYPHILSSDTAHLNWAVTAQRVPKSTLL